MRCSDRTLAPRCRRPDDGALSTCWQHRVMRENDAVGGTSRGIGGILPAILNAASAMRGSLEIDRHIRCSNCYLPYLPTATAKKYSLGCMHANILVKGVLGNLPSSLYQPMIRLDLSSKHAPVPQTTSRPSPRSRRFHSTHQEKNEADRNRRVPGRASSEMPILADPRFLRAKA